YREFIKRFPDSEAAKDAAADVELLTKGLDVKVRKPPPEPVLAKSIPPELKLPSAPENVPVVYPADLLEEERLERLEAEREEAKRKEAARKETERKEALRLEAERKEAFRLEAERREAERKEILRLEAEHKEAQRLLALRLEAERRQAQIETERLSAE